MLIPNLDLTACRTPRHTQIQRSRLSHLSFHAGSQVRKASSPLFSSSSRIPVFAENG